MTARNAQPDDARRNHRTAGVGRHRTAGVACGGPGSGRGVAVSDRVRTMSAGVARGLPAGAPGRVSRSGVPGVAGGGRRAAGARLRAAVSRSVSRSVVRGVAAGVRGAVAVRLAVLPVSPVTVALSVVACASLGRFWGGGRAASARAEAQAAKDAAATAFYELDTAQRELRISLETIGAVDDSPPARRAVAEFEGLGRRVDEASAEYIAAVDSCDLDRDGLDASEAARARARLRQAEERLRRVEADLRAFARGLEPLLREAESRLAQLAPAVERARQALAAATEALDAVRAKGFRADDLAARLAALSPELTRLNEGAGRHGVRETIRRAERVQRAAAALRDEAERLPQQAAEVDRRLVSLRTRTEALGTRAAQVEPVLSELRRRFSAACWLDLQPVPQQAAEAVAEAEERLRQARRAREEQRWAEVSALLGEVRSLLDGAEEGVSAARDRLRRLEEVAADPSPEVERTRFVIRDAQRLAMAGRTTPDPRHAGPLDEAVERLERAVGALESGGRHPDYWRFLTELDAIREQVAEVVQRIRNERAAQR